jgi:hypothetical protein
VWIDLWCRCCLALDPAESKDVIGSMRGLT